MPIRKTITLKAKEIESYVNWNYIGLTAGLLSVIVAVYNMNSYYKKLKEKSTVN